MLSTALFALSLAIAINAAPAPVPAELLERFVNLGDPDLVLALDGDGHSILNYSTYIEKLTFQGVSLTAPEIDYDYLNFTADPTPLDLSHLSPKKRQGCKDTQSKVIDKTERFVDWDVQMSNVACGNAGSIDIFVMSGYSVANSISVSAGIDVTVIKDWLKGSVGVDYSRTVTTSASVQNKGTVTQGNCGVMITQPLTTRKYGRVLQGCVGSLKQIGTFMADDRGTGSYNGVDWISGSVTMCTKPGSGPPLTRCNGEGEFK